MSTEKDRPAPAGRDREWIVPLLLFLLNLVLLFPLFFPNLSEIICFDEAGYAFNGRLLAQGQLPTLSSSPLSAALYFLAYLAVEGTSFWLLHSLTIGRLVLFGLLWLGTYLCARQLARHVSPLVAVALLLVSPAVPSLLTNGSDASYAAMSALAFWQILVFYERRRLRNLAAASAFVGLAALARSDGLVLAAALVVAAAILSFRPRHGAEQQPMLRRLGGYLLASILPCVAIAGGYVLIYWAWSGSPELGTGQRLYLAFEQGQGVAYAENYATGTEYAEGQVEARRLYGTPEENDYSILNAIKRNPVAYLRRVLHSALGMPRLAVSVYGAGLGLILLLFALRGIVQLLARREGLLLALILLWPSPLLGYFLTFFRAGYLLLPFFLVFCLAAVGLGATVKGRPLERLLWSAVMAGVAIGGWATQDPGMFLTGAVFLLGLWLTWLVAERQPAVAGAVVAILVLLGVALALGSSYPRPEFRTLGQAPDEQAVLFMRQQLAPEARVAAVAPCQVWTAGGSYVPISFEQRAITTGEEMVEWLAEKRVTAIYVDDRLRNREPATFRLIDGLIGQGLEVGISNGNVQVLMVDTSP